MSRKRRGPSRELRALLVVLLFAIGGGSCVYDSSDRCGDHMRYDAGRKVCVCEEDSVAVVGGCRPCAEGEVVVENACVSPPSAALPPSGSSGASDYGRSDGPGTR